MNFNTQWDGVSESGSQDAVLENQRNLQYLVANYGLSSREYFLSLHTHPFLIQALNSKESSSSSGPAILRSPVHYIKKEIDSHPDKILIGRMPENDITISIKQVSGHHAYFIQKREEWYVVDANSRNGVFVAGKKITPGQRAPLGSKVDLYLGRHVGLTYLEPCDMFETITGLYHSISQFPF
jgi:hypothetical protein